MSISLWVPLMSPRGINSISCITTMCLGVSGCYYFRVRKEKWNETGPKNNAHEDDLREGAARGRGTPIGHCTPDLCRKNAEIISGSCGLRGSKTINVWPKDMGPCWTGSTSRFGSTFFDVSQLNRAYVVHGPGGAGCEGVLFNLGF